MMTFRCYLIIFCLYTSGHNSYGQSRPEILPVEDASQIEIPDSIAIIEGKVETQDAIDSIQIYIWDYYHGGISSIQKILLPTLYSAKVENDRYRIEVKTKLPIHYFSIISYSKHQMIRKIEEILLEPGDHQIIDFGRYRIDYRGRGCDKNKYLSEIDNLSQKGNNYPVKMTHINLNREDIKKSIDYHDAVQKYHIDILQKFRTDISGVAYNIILADIIGKTEWRKYSIGSIYFNTTDTLIKRAMLDLYERELNKKEILLLNKIPHEHLGLSAYYPKYLLVKSDAEKNFKFWKGSPTVEEYFNYRNKQSRNKDEIDDLIYTSNGLIRNKLLLIRIAELRLDGEQSNIDYAIKRAIETSEGMYFKNMFQTWDTIYSKGSKILNFELIDQNGKKVKLSDFRNKVVFIDIWFTGCGACRIVAEAMLEVEAAIKDNQDVVFLSISIDKEKDKWLKSISKDAIPENKYRFAGKHYSGEKTIYLYTGGKGSKDDFIKRYVHMGYPVLMIVDREGKLFSGSPSRPSKGRVSDLVKELKEAMSR